MLNTTENEMQSKEEGTGKAFLPDGGDDLRAIIYEVQSFPRGSRGKVSRCETVNDVSTHSSRLTRFNKI